MIQLTIPNPKYTQNLSQTQNNKLLTQPRVSFNPKNLSNCTLKKPTICSSRRPLSSSHARGPLDKNNQTFCNNTYF